MKFKEKRLMNKLDRLMLKEIKSLFKETQRRYYLGEVPDEEEIKELKEDEEKLLTQTAQKLRIIISYLEDTYKV